MGVIISGGPASVNDPSSPKLDPAILELGKPILGICFGHQAIMNALGGTVQKGEVGEYGLTSFTVQESAGLFEKIEPSTLQVYASHFDTVSKLPEGFRAIGATPEDPYSATVNEDKQIYTLQFHPEVSHSQRGMDMIGAFIEKTGASRDWSIEKFIEMEIEAIESKVGDKRVFLLISGGVDSTVAYVLLARALGPERIYAMYVDTGFMRKNETEEIKKFLAEAGIQNLHVEDASEEYFEALKGVYDPEEKRKIIGDKFLEIQRRVASELELNPDEWLLGQGTIYPDTIESGGTKHADKIKTHHNRVPEIEELIRQGKIIEPLKELYKDEVRMVGEKLGLPAHVVHRHPFPGPGLAVRCLCLEEASEVTGVDLSSHETDRDELTLLPIFSVGVQGDERTYRHPVVLSYKNAEDHNWSELRERAPKLTNAFDEINRVLLMVAAQTQGSELSGDNQMKGVSVTPGYLTEERIQKLQEADKLVMDALPKLDPDGKIWQCPTVLLPLSINSEGQESIVLRPVSSMEAMTANFTELPWDGVQALAQELLQVPGISAVFYDITNKPPGTIEWE